MNPPDLLAALGPVSAALDRLGIPWYIGGSVASSAHGVPRTTLDVAHLRRWAKEIGVADLLDRARRDAGLPEEE